MKDIRLIVPLTPEEVKDRLEAAFPSGDVGEPEFVRTNDRMFCHIKPKVTPRSAIFRNNDGIDPLFVGMHLKEVASGTQLTVSPMTSGFLLAAKLFALPALWIIAPALAVHQEGWRILPKMLLACILITGLLWLWQRAYKKEERRIVRKIRETFQALSD